LFITFEGPEGSGKTLQSEALYQHLQRQGLPVLLTREPGGTSIGDQIRRVLLSPENVDMLPETEVLLFSASRAQLVREVIRPALERGILVICDRFADSTLAYQGYGHGLDLAALRAITEFATGGLWPDLSIYLDLEVEEGLRRKLAALGKRGEWNRLDQKELAFHERVRAGYHELAAAEPQRWLVLDATQPVAELQATIRAEVERRLASTQGRRLGSLAAIGEAEG